MKFSLVFAVLLASLPSTYAAQSSVMVPIEHVYSPKGFDTNDVTQIVVEGYLPNLCYKAPKTEVTVSEHTISVSVTAQFEDSNAFCLQAIVPFLETVSVGVLGKGTFNIVVNAGSRYEKTSSIWIRDPMRGSVDDYIYANLSYIERIPGTRRVALKGYNPSDCFELARVEVFSNDVDTYAVLPIMRQVLPECPMKMVAFSYEVEIPNVLEGEKVLLHARAMDGKSVNAIFYNKE